MRLLRGASGAGALGGTGGSAGTGGLAGTGGGGGKCKTSCLGNECGTAMPNGCGASVDCGPCGDNTDWCTVLPPKHQNAAYNGMIDIQQQHPEYFDLSSCLGCCSCQVKDVAALRSSLLAFLTAKGLVAITDPNDSLEIRVRASSETTAENVRIVSSAGYSLAKYTSTCSPANF